MSNTVAAGEYADSPVNVSVPAGQTVAAWLLVNPSNSKGDVFLEEVDVLNLPSVSGQLILTFNPTISVNGTADTPIFLRAGGTRPSIVSVYSGPTITSTNRGISKSFNSPAEVDVELLIPPGNKVLIQVVNPTNINIAYQLQIIWSERVRG